MSHRTSLEVQAQLMGASQSAAAAASKIYASPIARSAQHMVHADYAEVRAAALRARAEIDAALELIRLADVVSFVHPDGKPAVRAGEGFVFNRRGERVAVSIPVNE